MDCENFKSPYESRKTDWPKENDIIGFDEPFITYTEETGKKNKNMPIEPITTQTLIKDNLETEPDIIKNDTDYIMPVNNMDDIPEAGLIFVRSEDVLSMVAISITKQPYSTIGFFYVTDVTGERRVNVVLVDVYRFTVPKWFDKGATLKDLINNPLVSCIALKGLRPILNEQGEIDRVKTNNLNCKFRASIGKVLGYGTEASKEEIISQVFGYEVKNPTRGVTSVEMVNRVIQMIGMWDKVQQDGSLSAEAFRLLNAPPILGIDSNSKIQMIKILTSHFNQQEINNPNVANKLMQSYIVTNDVFGDMRKIVLPERDIMQVRNAQEVSAALNTDYMAKLVATFIRMLINDQEFFKTAVTGFNQTRIAEYNDKETIRSRLLSLVDSSNDLVNIIINWINTGETSYEKLIYEISKLNENNKEISTHNNLNLCKQKPLPIIDNNKLLLLRKGNSFNTRQDETFMIGAFMSLHKQVESITKGINNNINTVVDINELLRTVNDMSMAIGVNVNRIEPISGNYSTNCIIKVSPEQRSIVPFVLKSGKHICLPILNPDINNIDKDSLIEILEALDTMTDVNDRKYDNIRRIITERLALFNRNY